MTGPAASGKGTLARALADRLGLDYLDTGKLYRAVALAMRDAAAQADEMEILDPEILDPALAGQLAAGLALPLPASMLANPALMGEDVSALASRLAAMAPVRAALLDRQRAFAARPPAGKGAVLDGRDIGTVVLPGADVKFYVDARLSVRAERRHAELIKAGQTVSLGQIEADLAARDDRDKNRPIAPLKPAEDAIFIDSSDKFAHEVLAEALGRLPAF